MDDYRKGLDIDAPPARVYEALATEAGVRGWWNAACEGDFRPGGTFDLRFGRHHKRMRVETQRPDEVAWLCTDCRMYVGSETPHSEWTGTRMVFRLSPLPDGRTRLDFEHVGLRPSLVCFALCREGWDYYLESLANFARAGQGHPWAAAVEGAES